MGALFELLAEVMVAVAAAALAHLGAIGAASEARAEQPPAVQRTVLESGTAAVREALFDEDCPEAARLRSA